jgi:hypothetical protein
MTALVNGHNNNRQTVCVSLQNMYGRSWPDMFQGLEGGPALRRTLLFATHYFGLGGTSREFLISGESDTL